MWTSKLGGRYAKADIERQHDAAIAELKRLRKAPGNACADCGAAENSWASVSLGCFLCVRCASVHRGLGTHISKCKNTLGTYLWGPDELLAMREAGSARVNDAYLAQGGPALTPASGDADVRAGLQAKYGERRWYRAPRSQAPSAARPAPPACGTPVFGAGALEVDWLSTPVPPATAHSEQAGRPRAAGPGKARPLTDEEAAMADELFGCFGSPTAAELETVPFLAAPDWLSA